MGLCMGFARKTYIAASIALLIAVLSFPIITHFTGAEAVRPAYTEEVTESVETGSVGKFCWGLKRGKDGNPPEVGQKESALLKKYNALYMGDPTDKKIYLTFDEGYENGYTGQILDILREKNVKAIFFITGDFFDMEIELVRRIVEEGHEVGNHTMNHPSLTDVSRSKAEADILELSKLFKVKFNKDMRFLRPPKGEFSEDVLQLCDELSLRCLMWSFAYQDWLVNKQNGPDYALKKVTENLHNGAVLLLHAVSADNAGALADIIDTARSMGYEFGTPDDLYQYNVTAQ